MEDLFGIYRRLVLELITIIIHMYYLGAYYYEMCKIVFVIMPQTMTIEMKCWTLLECVNLLESYAKLDLVLLEFIGMCWFIGVLCQIGFSFEMLSYEQNSMHLFRIK